MTISCENMLEAYNQVKSNKGSAGIDGITIEDWIIISDKTGA